MPKEEKVTIKIDDLNKNSKVGEIVNYKGNMCKVVDAIKDGFLVMNQETKALSPVKV